MLLASEPVDVGDVPGVAVVVDSVTVPALGADRWYVGDDPSGLVRVELDGTARVTTVRLSAGWRARVGIAGLGAAVLQAFTAAAAARLTAWAEGVRPIEVAGAEPVPDAPSPDAGVVLRVWRDVGEYARRLDELSASTREVAGPDGRVVVAVRAGQPAGVELDPAWSTGASDGDLERSVGDALSAGLGAVAATPDLALASCPDLRALLTTGPGGR
jgi:hypothetical protein